MRYAIAAAALLLAFAAMGFQPDSVVERVDSQTTRELIDGHYYYRYDDGISACTWADHIDVICTEKAQ